MKKYLRLIRVKHYIKNVLIFTPLIFHGSLFEKNKVLSVILGFVAFSALASSIYILNDIRDIEKDKIHPVKRNRPIASGMVSLKTAYSIVILLLFIAFVANRMINSTVFTYGILLGYLILNIIYSMGLKNYPIVDITILVSGFLFRILYGAMLTGIEVSYWLYLTVVSFAFFLVLGKRRNELLRQNSSDTRPVLECYTKQFLDKHMYLCLTIGIVFYALWAMGTENSMLVFSVPLVLLICMKYNLNMEGNSDGDPVEVLFGDKILLVMSLIYGLLMLGALYS